jgi:hypothetical protein
MPPFLQLLILDQCSRGATSRTGRGVPASPAKQAFAPRTPSEIFSLEDHMAEMLASLDCDELRWLYGHLPAESERSLFHLRVQAEAQLRLNPPGAGQSDQISAN